MPTDDRRALLEQFFTLQRMANAQADDSDSVLREAFEEFLGDLVKLDPTAVRLRYRKDRMAKLLARAEEILRPAYSDWLAQQRSALAGIGAHQAESTATHLRAVLGDGKRGTVPSATGLNSHYFKRILDSEPFQGATLKEWAAEQKRKTIFRLGQQIKLGVSRGETLGDLVRRVRGRAVGRGQYVGGVLQTTTREAESIVRTAVHEVATHASFGVYEANGDVLEGYTLVVTMDGRTSPTCVNFGMSPERVYPVQGGPRPPFHFGCRTATAPAVDWRSLGMEPPEPGTRATATGQVPAHWDFDQWLRQAPNQYAVDLLGPTRARLFKEGRVDLRELLRHDKGRVRLTPVSDLARAA